jgi:gamma-glutamyltranspeptidase/glutathione hydrolase
MRLRSRLGCLLLSASLLACAQPASPESTARVPAAAAPAPSAQPERPQRGVPSNDPAQPGVAVGAHGAVASAEGHASRVGLAVLQAGGNAVDAAIAVAFALAVTHPSAGNVGGGGFMMVRLAGGTATAIDYRETAPGAAKADMYLGPDGQLTDARLVGPRAAGIPGTVAGMALAHARFGTRPWAELVQPAVALARDGHALDEPHAKDLARAVESMRKAGFEDTARAYLGAEGKPLQAGEVWRQPELAKTLDVIAAQGPRAFYEGPLAQALASGVQKLGGIWTAEDLARYRAVERPPLVFEYRGRQVLTMPPPSSGGIVMRQILGASELLRMHEQPWRSVEAFHLYIEAARRAYADRSELGDPDFVQVPTAKLISTEYIGERMKDVDPARATPSDKVKSGAAPAQPPAMQTTHYSVVDDWGNAVANTYTLNTGFGAKLAIPGTGVLLNNEMDDFASKPGSANVYGLLQREPNAIAPGKRMLSSMTPTILIENGQLRAVLGTPGGPTIINTVTQITKALVDYGQRLDAAVLAPRLHHQWQPDRAVVEPAFEAEIKAGLEARGHQVVHSPWGSFGHANCIEVDPATRGFRAVADVTRDGGEAVAY